MFVKLAVILQWTPLGFKMRDPDTLDDLSKERFEGTVLKAIFKSTKKFKKEPGKERGAGGGGAGQTLLRQVWEHPAKVLQNPGYILEFEVLYISRPEEIKNILLLQVKIKVEKKDEDEKEDVGKPAGEEQKMEIKKEEEEEVTKSQSTEAEDDAAAEGGAKPEPEMGRLVMTIDRQQKQLPFAPNDLLSTATMLDGDKVRR